MKKKTLSIKYSNPNVFFDNNLFKEQLTIDLKHDQKGWMVIVNWEFGPISVCNFYGGPADDVPTDPEKAKEFWLNQTKACIENMVYLRFPKYLYNGATYSARDYLQGQGAWMIDLRKEDFCLQNVA